MDLYDKDYIMDVKHQVNEVTTDDRHKSIEGLRKHIDSLRRERARPDMDASKKADIAIKIANIEKDIANIMDSIKKDKESGKTGSTIK